MRQELVETKDVAGLVTRQKVMEYLEAFGLTGQLNEQEANQFINIAQEFQLNPFKREIHCVPYGEGGNRRLSIIVGYEVYIKRAERTGKLNGWKAWTEGTGEVMKAVVEIYRKDWHEAFRHEVPWTEAVQRRKDGSLTPFWQRMPSFQLKKVAISQAFRLAFPDELGGMPYDPTELGISQDMIPSCPTGTKGQSEPSTQAQAEPIRFIGKPPAEAQPFPIPVVEQPVASVVPFPTDPFHELVRYLEEHEDQFTERHLDWIRNQVDMIHTPDKAGQMLKYAKRIVAEVQGEPSPENLRRLKAFTTSPIHRSTI
jgi:phage recombination protein Bet